MDKMESSTLTKYYIPGSGKTFRMMSRSIPSPEKFRQCYEEHEASIEDAPECGVSEGSRKNSLYMKLLTKLEIGWPSSEEAIEFLRLSIPQERVPFITKEQIQELFRDDFDGDWNSSEPYVVDDIQVIRLWQIYGFSIQSIYTSLLMTKEEVQEVITRYKTQVRQLWKKNRREAAVRQRIIGREYLNAIEGYLEESKGHVITLKKIKAHFADIFPSLHQPSTSSIRNILKRKLNYSSKILEKRN